MFVYTNPKILVGTPKKVELQNGEFATLHPHLMDKERKQVHFVSKFFLETCTQTLNSH